MTILLYAAETWPKKVTNTLEVFHKFCLKRILRAKFFNHRKSSNKLQRTNQSQIRLLVTIRRLRWFEIVLRIYYGCLFKYLLEWHTTHGIKCKLEKEKSGSAAAVLSIMTHEYNNTSLKKDSAVTSESLQNLDKIFNPKKTVITRLQGNNGNRIYKFWKLENKLKTVKTSLDYLEQYGRRNNIVTTGIPDSAQYTTLKWIVASLLSDTDVTVQSREVEDCHDTGKFNNGSRNTIIILAIENTVSKPYWIRNSWKYVITVSIHSERYKSFITQNFTIRNEQLAFNFRQLERKKQVFPTFTWNGMAYIKHNENSKTVLVTDITILQDMFPEFPMFPDD